MLASGLCPVRLGFSGSHDPVTWRDRTCRSQIVDRVAGKVGPNPQGQQRFLGIDRGPATPSRGHQKTISVLAALLSGTSAGPIYVERRRLTTPKPSKPTPKSAKVAGSGTVLLVPAKAMPVEEKEPDKPN